ncbi:MAG: type II toxin-antitoxin system Phd/YefM family antitoxin [Myxococcales bacterium]
MKAVGIKTLKAKLGEYVRMAKAGETILVTEREEVVAELRPARRQPLPASDLDAFFDELAAKGQMRRRSIEGPWKGPNGVGGLSGTTSQELLDYLREDKK